MREREKKGCGTQPSYSSIHCVYGSMELQSHTEHHTYLISALHSFAHTCTNTDTSTYNARCCVWLIQRVLELLLLAMFIMVLFYSREVFCFSFAGFHERCNALTHCCLSLVSSRCSLLFRREIIWFIIISVFFRTFNAIIIWCWRFNPERRQKIDINNNSKLKNIEHVWQSLTEVNKKLTVW